LFQEVFFAVARSPEGLAAAGSQRAWLFGIARNLVLGRYRSAARERVAVGLDATDEWAVVAAGARGDADPRLEAMRQAILRLPGPQREVIELKLGEDLTYSEIAASLDVPIGTVRSRMHHAVAALKEWASGADVERLMDGSA
jgi:RNA polymerase sigma-70 factor (ECF subfamily)